MGLFEEQIARKPDHYPWTKDFIKAMHNGFWTADEFDFTSDISQFKHELNQNEQEIIVKTLTAIGQVEISVKKFWANLGNTLPHPSITDLGYVMANTEVIHNEAYEKLLETLHLTDSFEELLNEPVLATRVDYLRKYLRSFSSDERQQFLYSIALFTLFVENVSLFSQFYIILWFNRFKNVLKDTAQQVQYTRNEEAVHALVGVKLINTLRAEYPELWTQELSNRIRQEAKIAGDKEIEIIRWIMDDYKQEKLDANVLSAFIMHRINTSLNDIDLAPVYTNPERIADQWRWFDEELYGYNLTDFFAKKPVDYTRNNKSYDDIF